jgi:hypothetical protein
MNFTYDLFRTVHVNFIHAEIILQVAALLPTSVQIYTSIHTKIYIPPTYTHTHTHTIHIHTHTNTHTHTHTNTHTQTHTHKHTHTLTQTHTYKHTHTHIHTHTPYRKCAHYVLDRLNSANLFLCWGQRIQELRPSHLCCHSVYTEAFREGNSVRGFLENVSRRLRSRDNFELGETPTLWFTTLRGEEIL